MKDPVEYGSGQSQNDRPAPTDEEGEMDAQRHDADVIQMMIDNNLSLKTELQMVFDQMDLLLMRF